MREVITINCETTNFKEEKLLTGGRIEPRQTITNVIFHNLKYLGIVVNTITIAKDLGEGHDEVDVFKY